MSIVAGLKPFKLQKLKIFCYKEIERKDISSEFEVMFNPESVQKNFNNKYHSVPGTVNYAYSLPATVRMKLIFDDTQVNEYVRVIAINKLDNNHKSVSDRVDKFLKLIVKTEGEIHEPQHLTIAWGKTLDFKCKLDSLDINYTLFDRNGDPLRAELNVSFIEDDSPAVKSAEEDLQSPDLTHYRMVKDGDQLPLMCESIYGSPNYYMLVARANNLNDFRNLKPGQEIYFPPIEK